MVIEVNQDNFKEKVLEASKEKPVVVDFWSPHCGPCLSLSPVLDKLSSEYENNFIFTKLNVDQNFFITQEYNISGVPTVKIFKDGKVVDEFIGSLPELLIRKWLEDNL